MRLTISQRTRSILTAVAGVLLLVALAINGLAAPSWRDTGVAAALVIASVVAGTPIALRAIQALRVRAFSIDLLVTIAVVGALFIGEYVESAVVSFLFLFGAWLEARTLERTRRSLRDLVDLAPTRATVLRDGERVTVDAEDVLVGETVVVTSGERIAVDGIVTAGAADVSEAAITGEPVPVGKEPGDTVHSGTINDTGYLEVRAERVGDDTTFAHIIELVEEAQESRTRTQRFLERFAKVYTPAVIVLAILVLLISRDLEFALVFLVIACPGALVISVPVAVVAGLGNIAKHGVLVKSGEALEDLAAADTLVVDKTGTLTRGRPSVTDVQPVGPVSETELLTLAAALESTSEHHLARAVVAAATERGIPVGTATDVEVIKGGGLTGTVEGQRLTIGTTALLAQAGIDLAPAAAAHAERLEREGNTVVLVAAEAEVIGLIAIADELRPEAADAIAQLRQGGIRHVVMLTGDNEHTAALIAGKLGLDEVRARLLPEHKAEIVKELQAAGRKVAMVGDGVNDAPALATAEVGIAMGASGTDVSMETADVILLTDRLDQLAHANRAARATVRVMRQNTTLALVTVAVLIAAVLAKSVGLAGGMLVHEVSVLLVILNAVRLVRLRGPQSTPVPSAVTDPASPASKEPVA